MSAKYSKGKKYFKTNLPHQVKAKIAISGKKDPKIKISRRRLWIYRLISIIFIPAFLIFAFELGLRIADYGFAPEAIISCYANGQKKYCDNVKFSWLFFPPNIAREFAPFIFPADKAQNTYRIFVFGSSAAQGDPDFAYSFSRILGCMLKERYPDVNFEVINTGMTAINSHVVVRIAQDCAQYKPDFFIIYMGNNEVIGPYGAGTVFAPLSDNLTLIKWGIDFRGTRLGQLLTNLSRSIGWGKTPRVWRNVEMFLSKQVPIDDPKLQIVYNNFESNLNTILKTAREKNIPVLLSTVAGNLKDCPPFASLHRKDISQNDVNRFDVIYKQARQLDEQGQYQKALEIYLEAEKTDNQYAELQYCIGRCHYLQGNFDEAKDRFIRSRDLDTIRLRADSRINEIIKKTAKNAGSEGIYLADAAEAINEQSPHKIAGSELFYEHVHLNFQGNYVLAKTVLEQIEKAIPERIKSQQSGLAKIDDPNKYMKTLVYSDFDKYTIAEKLLNEYITRPPFTNQLNHNEQVENLKKQITSLQNKLSKQAGMQINADYRNALENNPADWILHWKYAKFLADALQNYQQAVNELNKVEEIVPRNYWAKGLLGTLYGKLGKYDESLSYLKEAAKIRPFYAETYHTMGISYQNKGLLKEAKSCYEKSILLDPGNYASYINLSFLFADEGKMNEAIKVCRKGLEYFSDSTDLHYNLGVFLNENGQREEAVKEFRAVLKINPGYPLPKEIQDFIKINK